jgi:putative ABC transport system permease protein
MGRVLLVCRLASRDLRRRWNEALLLLLALTVAATTLTLGLVLHGVTDQPYAQTRAATRGPDVVAESSFVANGSTSPDDLAGLVALQRSTGVRASSGPYPMTTAVFRTPTLTAGADVEGRTPGGATVDQPKVTAGTWIQPGGVVVERTFATAASLHLGQRITLNERAFKVVGFAVTAAFSPFPEIGCQAGCSFGSIQLDSTDTGLMWTTEAAARDMATRAAPLTYFSNLKLVNPASANVFEGARGNDYNGYGTPSTVPFLRSWQQTGRQDSNLVRNEQIVLLVGSWLLAILAVASVAVLVGGRMADQMRRVGLLKSVGSTPGLVASVLLAEYLVLSVVGATVGLFGGWLFAPIFTHPGAGLLGAAPTPPLTTGAGLLVFAVSLGVALLAALVPALRAASTSTVRALADSARPPRRAKVLIALSSRLPVPLMIAFRVMARRLRRTVLSILSVFVTVSGIVAVLIAHGRLSAAENSGHFGFAGANGLINPRTQGANQVLLVVTAMLIALAAVNAIFVTRAIAQDARHATAITRALGATPGQVSAGLSSAQTLPALLGALLGIPGGFALYDLAKHGGSSATLPSPGLLLTVVVAAVVAVAMLTAIPVRLAARRPVAPILQTELA